VIGLITILGAIGLSKLYARHDPAIPAGLVVSSSPALLARGQYIVSFSCAGCHSANQDFQPPLTGGFDMASEIPIPIGSMVISNIASDGQIKEYTDEQLFRAIRHGIRRDGSLLAFMSNLSIREYTDDDIRAIIAYLRSLPPADSPKRGGDDLNFLAALLFGAGMFPDFTPGQQTIAQLAPSITPAYGLYVATLGDCRGCHGTDMTGAQPSSVGPGAPNPRPLVASLSLDQFRQMLRTGKRPGGSELKMPWQTASRMTDDDLAALYAYLTTPVK
jgi:mono/diheme cytochrome c family protein